MRTYARCAIALLFVIAGCQSKPSNGGDGGDYPSTYPSDVKHEVLAYYKANPPNAPTSVHTDEPTKIEQPGWWPFENQRVFFVYHDRLPDHPGKGFYAAMISDAVDDDATPPPNPTPPPASQPVPPSDLLIYQGWIYVNGDRPRVGTRAVIAEATGCALLIYFYPGVNGLKQRVCCLEGDPDVGLWACETAGGNKYFVPVGTFIELETNADGTFNHWVTDSSGQHVRTLDTIQGDSYHLQVMQAVQAGQHQYQVS